MADNNRYQSWNPLSYSQNLCVVSNNGSTTSGDTIDQTSGLMTSRATDSLMADSMSSLDLQNANNGINKMVNDLIASNDNELSLKSNACSSGSNPSQPFLRNEITTNAYDCGDFGLNSGHKLNGSLAANGLKRMDGFGSGSGTQSGYNPLIYMPSPVVMSSQTYPEMKSLPQSILSSNQSQQPLCGRLSDSMNSMTDSMLKALTNSSNNSLVNPLTNQLISSLTSSISQSNSRVVNQSIISQSNINSKPSLPMPYNRSQSYQLSQFVEMSTSDLAAMTGRPVRSIRARNASQSATEPINKLNYFFDKCCEQFKHLEKERKKIESELIQTFVGQKISSANNIPIQRLPQNASKIDRIITDMYREHAKVITIVAKMEQLKGRELSEAIHNSIQKWYEVIRDLFMKRKYEIQRSAPTAMTSSLPEDSFVQQMCEVMKSLFAEIRCVRTALWCALVVTLYDYSLA